MAGRWRNAPPPPSNTTAGRWRLERRKQPPRSTLHAAGRRFAWRWRLLRSSPAPMPGMGKYVDNLHVCDELPQHVGLLCRTVPRTRTLVLELAFHDVASSSPASSPRPFLRHRDAASSASLSLHLAVLVWLQPRGVSAAAASTRAEPAGTSGRSLLCVVKFGICPRSCGRSLMRAARRRVRS